MGYIDVQSKGNIPEPRGADAVCACLILLDLLKFYANKLCQALLGHAGQPTALSYPLANMNIYFVRHHDLLSNSAPIISTLAFVLLRK
jgi:hypothetical protein